MQHRAARQLAHEKCPSMPALRPPSLSQKACWTAGWTLPHRGTGTGPAHRLPHRRMQLLRHLFSLPRMGFLSGLSAAFQSKGEASDEYSYHDSPEAFLAALVSLSHLVLVWALSCPRKPAQSSLERCTLRQDGSGPDVAGAAARLLILLRLI